MNLFDVYSLWDIEPVRTKGCTVWDSEGNEYLDLYGGHAVISIGHAHPRYLEAIQQQVAKIGFYSNSVRNPLQVELAEKLGALSGYPDYSLFLCNSGAEANENALKLASFHTGKKRVIAFTEAFHGRTSGAVAVTNNPAIQAPFNQKHKVTFVPFGDATAVKSELAKGDVTAVIIEGIQGIAGIIVPGNAFLRRLSQLCREHSVPLILDEIQSGYGRTGDFFAHQSAGDKTRHNHHCQRDGQRLPHRGGCLSRPPSKQKRECWAPPSGETTWLARQPSRFSTCSRRRN
jgi:acetylornithine/N-succinyldiaminopimelate aminotransferase